MSNPLKKSEITWGCIYAFIQFFVLGDIAYILYYLWDIPLWRLQVGIFALNFLCTIIIFRSFLANACATALRKPFRVLAYAIIGLLLYFAGNFWFSILIMLIRPDYLNLNDASISEMAQQSGIWMTVGAVLFVPLAEETVFRGLCFRGIYDRNPVLAWILSVCLFSAVHILGYIGTYDPVMLLLAFLQYIPAGICLAFIYKKTNTIITPILMHTLINLIGMTVR